MRLIDADALIESLTVDPIECMGCPEPEWIDELIQILNTAPSVLINCIQCKNYYETEDDNGVEGHCKMDTAHLSQRTGAWILECDSEGEGDNLYRCSECGCEYGCQEYDKPNFCLDCGAYMKR